MNTNRSRLLLIIMIATVVGPGSRLHAEEPSAEAAQRRQELHIAVQEICPVSGQKLGDHGPPVRVAVGRDREQIYLCCSGCLGKKVAPKHWSTVHVNLAKAQKMCPVMKKELPRQPKWTIVEGRIVYVCCPPCIDRIEKSPEPFLQKIDDLYTTALQDQRKN